MGVSRSRNAKLQNPDKFICMAPPWLDIIAIMSENETVRLTRILYSLAIGLTAGIIGIALFIVFSRLGALDSRGAGPFNAVGGEEFDGTISIAPPRPMPDFTLTNQHGEAMNLSDLRGRYALLTFGYTHCPDVCPLTLNEFRRVRESLDELAAHVAFVFVSVDGQRDRPAVLRRYFAARQLEGLIGLTGAEADVRQLGRDYGLSFERSGENPHLVNHTTGAFLLDPAGRWIRRYPFGVMPSLIVDDLTVLLAS